MALIYKMTLGITMHRWLCSGCKSTREAVGWLVESVKTPSNLTLFCDDCDLRTQEASK